jgi:hypothetical protein
MDTQQSPLSFTEQHHALLFGLVAKEVIERAGKAAGEAAVRAAVRRYGEQRGRRMALRALANEDELSMIHFLTYGEWRSGTGLGRQETTVAGTDVRTIVPRCPWALAWLEADLSQYGRLYCQEIDWAVVRGFNLDLNIHVHKTQTNDGEPCDFLYHQAALLSGDTLAYIRDRSAGLADRTVMPWDYHCGHLYQVLEVFLTAEFGKTGREAARAGLEAFAARFGEQAAQAVLSCREIDFNRLPGFP